MVSLLCGQSLISYGYISYGIFHVEFNDEIFSWTRSYRPQDNSSRYLTLAMAMYGRMWFRFWVQFKHSGFGFALCTLWCQTIKIIFWKPLSVPQWFPTEFTGRLWIWLTRKLQCRGEWSRLLGWLSALVPTFAVLRLFKWSNVMFLRTFPTPRPFAD